MSVRIGLYMECSPIISALRAAIHRLHGGAWRAAGNRHIGHLRQAIGPRTGPAVRRLVERACRKSLLPPIFALGAAGGLLTAQVASDYRNRSVTDPLGVPGDHGAGPWLPVEPGYTQEEAEGPTDAPKLSQFIGAGPLALLMPLPVLLPAPLPDIVPTVAVFLNLTPLDPAVLGEPASAGYVLVAEPAPLAAFAIWIAAVLLARGQRRRRWRARWPGH